MNPDKEVERGRNTGSGNIETEAPATTAGIYGGRRR